MEIMTQQQAVDKAWKGIVAQGGKGTSDDTWNGGCKYRTSSGRKCAAGHLIPDEEYNDTFDSGMTLDSVMSMSPTLRQFGVLFLGDLMGAHDRAEDMDEMHRNFIGVCEKYKLDPSNIKLPEMAG